MESLQIRLPKKLLEKVDQLVNSGLFRSRSEILREALQSYIIQSNCNGCAPFIVGPFTDPNFEVTLQKPIENLIPSKKEIEEIHRKLKDFSVK
jgi:hypothetical protein